MQHYLTAKKLEELKTELEDYRTSRRMEVADRLKRAKELGDLSENSEYMEARDEQQFVETHISELEDIIKNSQIITMTHGTKAVQIGTTFEAERGGKSFKFTVVGADEAKPASGLISNESPIGKAFLGRKIGDVVTIKAPVGDQKYTIASIQ
jgi:transcription elongation factor GreA